MDEFCVRRGGRRSLLTAGMFGVRFGGGRPGRWGGWMESARRWGGWRDGVRRAGDSGLGVRKAEPPIAPALRGTANGLGTTKTERHEGERRTAGGPALQQRVAFASEGIVVRTDPSATVGMTDGGRRTADRLGTCPTRNARQTGRLSHQERQTARRACGDMRALQNGSGRRVTEGVEIPPRPRRVRDDRRGRRASAALRVHSGQARYRTNNTGGDGGLSARQ